MAALAQVGPLVRERGDVGERKLQSDGSIPHATECDRKCRTSELSDRLALDHDFLALRLGKRCEQLTRQSLAGTPNL